MKHNPLETCDDDCTCEARGEPHAGETVTTPQEEKCECTPMFNDTIVDTSFCKLHTPQETMEERFDNQFPMFDVRVTVRSEDDIPKKAIIEDYYKNLDKNLKSFIKSEIEKARQEERMRCIDGIIENLKQERYRFEPPYEGQKDEAMEKEWQSKVEEYNKIITHLQSEKENIINSLTPKGDK